MSEDKSLQLVRGFDREIGIGTQHIRDLLSRHLERKIRNKFRVSAAEVEDQNLHQSAVIGVAAIVKEEREMR